MRKTELRVGRIVKAFAFPEARKPAYKLEVDFGMEIGVKRSSAQITDLYTPDDLLDKLVVGILNFPPQVNRPYCIGMPHYGLL